VDINLDPLCAGYGNPELDYASCFKLERFYPPCSLILFFIFRDFGVWGFLPSRWNYHI
jgi:hypothetical protein